ncbi:hypothetical protein EK904_003447 [Melospiza melodia maxima]|nr:hypothetical protein EK904_003447 [Melospiza melodia maxima]
MCQELLVAECALCGSHRSLCAIVEPLHVADHRGTSFHFPSHPCPLSQSPLLLFLQYVKALAPALLLFAKTSTQLGLKAASRCLVLTLLGQALCQGPLWVCRGAQLWHSGTGACCHPSALGHKLFPPSASPFTLLATQEVAEIQLIHHWCGGSTQGFAGTQPQTISPEALSPSPSALPMPTPCSGHLQGLICSHSSWAPFHLRVACFWAWDTTLGVSRSYVNSPEEMVGRYQLWNQIYSLSVLVFTSPDHFFVVEHKYHKYCIYARDEAVQELCPPWCHPLPPAPRTQPLARCPACRDRTEHLWAGASGIQQHLTSGRDSLWKQVLPFEAGLGHSVSKLEECCRSAKRGHSQVGIHAEGKLQQAPIYGPLGKRIHPSRATQTVMALSVSVVTSPGNTAKVASKKWPVPGSGVHSSPFQMGCLQDTLRPMSSQTLSSTGIQGQSIVTLFRAEKELMGSISQISVCSATKAGLNLSF